MKNLRSFSAACVLALLLTMPASAGYIQTGIIGPQPSPSPSPTTTTTDEGTNASSVEGQIQTGDTSDDSVAQAALTLLQSVLALF